MRTPKRPPSNWLRVTAGDRSHLVSFESRDWKVIYEPDIPSGRAWMREFGFWGPPGSTVARGLEIGYTAPGNTQAMLNVSRSLLAEVVGSQDLLRYNYQVTLQPGLRGWERFGGGVVGGVAVLRGKTFALSLRPGHCQLEADVPDEHTPAVIDLRSQKSLIDDNGRTLTIHRRTKGLAWPTELPPLISFLSSVSEPAVSILNNHR